MEETSRLAKILETYGHVEMRRSVASETSETLKGIVADYFVSQEIPPNKQHAIRSVFKKIPLLQTHILKPKFREFITKNFGDGYALVKSLYFNKNMDANWVVSYHQDLTINVVKKTPQVGFENWLPKDDFYSVQPPIEMLEDAFTIRIHLDDAMFYNGALTVIDRSHLLGICTIDELENVTGNETVCQMKECDMMAMKPLIFHKSNRAERDLPRRVLHLEFSRATLPDGMEWAEYYPI